MPAPSPINSTFNVGRDVTAVIVASDGTRIDLIGEIEINWRALHETVTHEPINAPPHRRFLPMGHEFTLTLERRGPANEALFSQIEAGYWAGGIQTAPKTAGRSSSTSTKWMALRHNIKGSMSPCSCRSGCGPDRRLPWHRSSKASPLSGRNYDPLCRSRRLARTNIKGRVVRRSPRSK